MTDQHPVPPPELVQQWVDDIAPLGMLPLCIQAARWGADQELEACCEWLEDHVSNLIIDMIRAARRPKPPSLKELALESLHHLEAGCEPNIDLLRRALEQLDD